jgi:hypothetical protein
VFVNLEYTRLYLEGGRHPTHAPLDTAWGGDGGVGGERVRDALLLKSKDCSGPSPCIQSQQQTSRHQTEGSMQQMLDRRQDTGDSHRHQIADARKQNMQTPDGR